VKGAPAECGISHLDSVY